MISLIVISAQRDDIGKRIIFFPRSGKSKWCWVPLYNTQWQHETVEQSYLTLSWTELLNTKLCDKNHRASIIIIFIFQIHAVSRTLQGRQREPSVKTLRSPFSAEFWRHCVLSGGTQCHACPRHQSKEMEI